MQNKKSLKNKIWQAKEFDEIFVEAIAQKYRVSDLLARLISDKVNNLDDVENFLNPKIKNYLDTAFCSKDIKQGAKRLCNAILDNEKNCLFADYDVDGSTSCAILVKLLKVFKASYKVYVPNRFKEGYGLSMQAVDFISMQTCKLLITLDCGAASQKEVTYAKKIGLDVIVVDDHMADFILKDAVALINPNRLDEEGKFSNPAAVGVTYLFIIGLLNVSKSYPRLQSCLKNFNPLALLDFVALGTICDVVPLTGINRAFVCQGLKVLSKRINID